MDRNPTPCAGAAASAPPIRFGCEAGVATITLDNPAARNAIDRRSSDCLVEAIDRIAGDPSVRVVLIRASGPMFCPGASMSFLAPDEPGMAQRVDALLAHLNPALARLRSLDVVIVAAVHGAVAGGGLGYLNLADLVVAARSTKFSLAYSRIGATPDLGATWHLPRLLGERRALELLLLSDGFDAQHAQALGLVNFVVPDEELEAETARLVERLRVGAAGAFAAIKRLVRQSHGNELAAQLDAERREIVAAARGLEFGEGVRAFGERRAPDFVGAGPSLAPGGQS